MPMIRIGSNTSSSSSISLISVPGEADCLGSRRKEAIMTEFTDAGHVMNNTAAGRVTGNAANPDNERFNRKHHHVRMRRRRSARMATMRATALFVAAAFGLSGLAACGSGTSSSSGSSSADSGALMLGGFFPRPAACHTSAPIRSQRSSSPSRMSMRPAACSVKP